MTGIWPVKTCSSSVAGLAYESRHKGSNVASLNVQWWKKKGRRQATVSALSFLECFDTAGWLRDRKDIQAQNTATYPQRLSSRKLTYSLGVYIFLRI